MRHKVSLEFDRRDYLRAVGADVHLGGDAAFYSIVHGFIACPEAERVVDASALYAIQLHEHVHWSGHRERKNRTFDSRFGDKAYVFEELVAELGAALLTAQLAIAGTLRHTEYLATWAQLLRDDPQALWTAAASASDAVAFLDALVGDASTLENVTTDEAA